MSEHRFFHIVAGTEPRRLAKCEHALAAIGAEGYVWLDFFNPAKEDLGVLVDALGLHPLSIDDCFDDEQIPKVDVLPTNTFILFNDWSYEGQQLAIDEVDFFLGKSFLVSVHRNDAGRRVIGPNIDNAVRLAWEDVRRGPDFLLHVILDCIVDDKFRALELVQEELDVVEESIIEDPTRFRPEVLLRLRRRLLGLRKSLFHERELLVRLCRRDSPFISEKAVYHYRDIYDHLSRFFEVAEISREMVSSHMEMYLSLVNNRMTLIANQTNRVMKRLTWVNTIFMPLTLLAGIGGMSEWSMMTGTENWRIAYPAFLLLMAALGAVNFYVLRLVDHRAEAAEDEPAAEPAPRDHAGRPRS
ncbi:MAG: magnesium transporter CorA family protein [Deltaproteobacteria bacterium]|nr:magnesium transporter CorA family protein [Deltaproteobacteria bacterium]